VNEDEGIKKKKILIKLGGGILMTKVR